jgi:hypothetical protein
VLTCFPWDPSAYTGRSRQADLFSIVNATDIHGTKYDDPANPIAPGGKLNTAITPATYVSFVNFVETAGLARFGLHNGTSALDFFVINDPNPVLQVLPTMKHSSTQNGNLSPWLLWVTQHSLMISFCSLQ